MSKETIESIIDNIYLLDGQQQKLWQMLESMVSAKEFQKIIDRFHDK